MNKLKRPLLKHEILAAQEGSLSAAECARRLGVAIQTYRKYAKVYGLYDNVLNKSGVGTAKGFAKSQKHSTKLKEIFDNKHPRYPLQRLRKRMVMRGLIKDECSICKFTESRVTDNKKPLLMVFKEEFGDYSPSNLITLCYNCCFLTRGVATVINARSIERSLVGKPPTYRGKEWEDYHQSKHFTGEAVPPTPEETQKIREETSYFADEIDELTPEEIEEIRRQIQSELS